MKPWLIGELNPYGTDQRYALFPRPAQSAGARLCHHILQLREREYLRTFERRNLCIGKWSQPKARAEAQSLILQAEGAPIIMLGAKVAAAFGLESKPFQGFSASWMPWNQGQPWSVVWPWVSLPHPSGLSRLWNGPGSFQRARDLVAKAVELCR